MSKKEILKTYPGAIIVESEKLIKVKPQSVISARYNNRVDFSDDFEDSKTLGGMHYGFTFVCNGDKDHTSLTGDNDFLVKDEDQLLSLLKDSIDYYCDKHPIAEYTIEIDYDSLEKYVSKIWKSYAK